MNWLSLAAEALCGGGLVRSEWFFDDDLGPQNPAAHALPVEPGYDRLYQAGTNRKVVDNAVYPGGLADLGNPPAEPLVRRILLSIGVQVAEALAECG